MNMTKTIKIVSIAIEAVLIAVFIILCVAVGVKNRHIKEYKATIAAQETMMDSLQSRCDRYGQMEGISVNTTFVINNKNIMSVNTNAVSNVTRNYAVMTKQEVLKAIDSLQKVNKTE